MMSTLSAMLSLSRGQAEYSEGLDDERIGNLPPERISSDDRIEIFPDVADPPVADRKPEYISIAILASVGQNHVATLFDENPAAVTRDGKLHLFGSEILRAVCGGCHPEVDDLGGSDIAAKPPPSGWSALPAPNFIH